VNEDTSGEHLRIDIIFRQQASLLGQVAVGMGLSADEGQDVLQDVFVELLEAGPKFDSTEHVRRWLLRVTINRCILGFRRRKSQSRRILEFFRRSSEDRTVSEEPEKVTIAAEEKDVVREGLGKMDKLLRVPLVLKYFCGMNSTEIGQVLDLKPGTVRKRLSEGRTLLAKILLEIGVKP
jgi:RNA polymerase sigma-70 factor (ECF subfamily)